MKVAGLPLELPSQFHSFIADIGGVLQTDLEGSVAAEFS